MKKSIPTSSFNLLYLHYCIKYKNTAIIYKRFTFDDIDEFNVTQDNFPTSRNGLSWAVMDHHVLSQTIYDFIYW